MNKQSVFSGEDPPVAAFVAPTGGPNLVVAGKAVWTAGARLRVAVSEMVSVSGPPVGRR